PRRRHQRGVGPRPRRLPLRLRPGLVPPPRRRGAPPRPAAAGRARARAGLGRRPPRRPRAPRAGRHAAVSNVPGQPAPGATAVVSRDLPVPASALAVAAHPDDAEFGAGATLAKWAAAGCRVHLVVCTDGSKGTWDPAQDLA